MSDRNEGKGVLNNNNERINQEMSYVPVSCR